MRESKPRRHEEPIRSQIAHYQRDYRRTQTAIPYRNGSCSQEERKRMRFAEVSVTPCSQRKSDTDKEYPCTVTEPSRPFHKRALSFQLKSNDNKPFFKR